MARAVTTQHKTVATVAAWIVAFIIFFPILYTIITSFKSETEAIAGFNLIPSGTLESYVEVQAQSGYFKFFLNSVILSVGSTILALVVGDPGGLVNGLLADQANQGHTDVDAVHQDDAGGGGAVPDLPDLPQPRPARQPHRPHRHADADQPADRGLDALHLFPRDPGRDPRGRPHGRRVAVGRDLVRARPRWRCRASPRRCCSTSSSPGTRRSGRSA